MGKTGVMGLEEYFTSDQGTRLIRHISTQTFNELLRTQSFGRPGADRNAFS